MDSQRLLEGTIRLVNIYALMVFGLVVANPQGDVFRSAAAFSFLRDVARSVGGFDFELAFGGAAVLTAIALVMAWASNRWRLRSWAALASFGFWAAIILALLLSGVVSTALAVYPPFLAIAFCDWYATQPPFRVRSIRSSTG